jgi:3-dehydroquinate dehydratase II
MASILVLHGPNLNLLGTREPETYGKTTLSDVNDQINTAGQSLGHKISCQQSNDETWLINRIQHTLEDTTDFLIFNPAALTHTSIALRDALLATALPFIEVHLSNMYQREAFRRQSYFSDIAHGVIAGLGSSGYLFALQAAHFYLTTRG